MLPVGSRARLWRSAGSSSRVGVAGERVAGREVLAQHARRSRRASARPVGLVAAGERQLEVELVEPVGARDVAQPRCRRAAGRAASRSRRAARRRPSAGSPTSTRRRAWTRGDVRGELGVEVGGGEVGRLEHAVHERADVRRRPACRRAATARRAARLVRRRGAGGARPASRGSSSTTRLLGLARHARLVRAGGDVAVGRPPPAPSSSRSKRAAASSAGCARRPGPGDAAAPSVARSTLMQPGRLGARAPRSARSPPRRSASRRPAGGDVAVARRARTAAGRAPSCGCRTSPPTTRPPGAARASARRRRAAGPRRAARPRAGRLWRGKSRPVERRRRSSARRPRRGRGRRPAGGRRGIQPGSHRYG